MIVFVHIPQHGSSHMIKPNADEERKYNYFMIGTKNLGYVSQTEWT